MKEQIEKQAIEEMAKDLCDIECKGMKCNICDYGCEYRMQAEALYNAGYRKQSEGEWVIDKGDRYAKCSCCGMNYEILPQFAPTIFKINNKFCRGCGAHMKGGAE